MRRLASALILTEIFFKKNNIQQRVHVKNRALSLRMEDFKTTYIFALKNICAVEQGKSTSVLRE